MILPQMSARLGLRQGPRASEHLKGLRTKNDDQKTGVEIVRKALSWPARQIAIDHSV